MDKIVRYVKDYTIRTERPDSGIVPQPDTAVPIDSTENVMFKRMLALSMVLLPGFALAQATGRLRN